MNTSETPAERIARKKCEAELRKEQAEKEQDWRDIWGHVHGIVLIAAKFSLGYKPTLKK